VAMSGPDPVCPWCQQKHTLITFTQILLLKIHLWTFKHKNSLLITCWIPQQTMLPADPSPHTVTTTNVQPATFLCRLVVCRLYGKCICYWLWELQHWVAESKWQWQTMQ
jgi:hypothetical protein